MKEDSTFLIICLTVIAVSALIFWFQVRNIRIERRELKEHEKDFLKQLKTK
jgi:hypothetical protein